MQYQKSLLLKPDVGWTLYKLAKLYEELGQQTTAIANYTKALTNAKDDLRLQAWCNFRLGKYTLAIQLAEQEIKSNNSAAVYYDLVAFYSLLNNKEKALIDLNMALSQGYNDWKHLETDK